MTKNNGRFTLAHGAIISILLHMCVAAPCVLAGLYFVTPRTHSSNPLQLELFGQLSNRQTEARQKRIVVVQQRDPHPPEAHRKEEPTEKVQSPQDKVFKSAPIESSPDLADAVHLPAEQDVSEHAFASGGAQPRAGGDMQQQQQAIAAHNDINDRIASYSARVSKILSAHFSYPQELKKKKIEGISLISFVIMESGEIRPNTLVVKRSSGNAALDASALRSVLGSAPFPKPPRELTYEFEENFGVDR